MSFIHAISSQILPKPLTPAQKWQHTGKPGYKRATFKTMVLSGATDGSIHQICPLDDLIVSCGEEEMECAWVSTCDVLC